MFVLHLGVMLQGFISYEKTKTKSALQEIKQFVKMDKSWKSRVHHLVLLLLEVLVSKSRINCSQTQVNREKL